MRSDRIQGIALMLILTKQTRLCCGRRSKCSTIINRFNEKATRMLFRCGAISKIEHAQTLVKSESFDMRKASNGNTDSVVDCLMSTVSKYYWLC